MHNVSGANTASKSTCNFCVQSQTLTEPQRRSTSTFSLLSLAYRSASPQRLPQHIDVIEILARADHTFLTSAQLNAPQNMPCAGLMQYQAAMECGHTPLLPCDMQGRHKAQLGCASSHAEPQSMRIEKSKLFDWTFFDCQCIAAILVQSTLLAQTSRWHMQTVVSQ